MTDNIEVFTQSSIRIKGSAGTIYFDPFNINGNPQDADFVFLTHDHYDHYSSDDVSKVVAEGRTVIVVPQKMAATVSNEISGYAEVVSVAPGESNEINGLKFETVASYNISKAFHPKSAGWCGYVVEVDGEKIYVAGDTDATAEAKAVVCDIAMVPIGGTYTMTPKEAADLINVMQPKVAIPTHFGSIVGSPKDADAFEKNVNASIEVVRKIRF